MRRKRIVWGIQMCSKRETWGDPLGVAWVLETVLGTGSSWRPIPSGVPRWPAQFRTRASARALARRLREHYAYLGPHHHWQFRPVGLEITVRVKG